MFKLFIKTFFTFFHYFPVAFCWVWSFSHRRIVTFSWHLIALIEPKGKFLFEFDQYIYVSRFFPKFYKRLEIVSITFITLMSLAILFTTCYNIDQFLLWSLLYFLSVLLYCPHIYKETEYYYSLNTKIDYLLLGTFETNRK